MHLITEHAFIKVKIDVHLEVPRGAALGNLWGVGGGCSLWSLEAGGTLWGVGGAGPAVKKEKLTQDLSKKA